MIRTKIFKIAYTVQGFPSCCGGSIVTNLSENISIPGTTYTINSLPKNQRGQGILEAIAEELFESVEKQVVSKTGFVIAADRLDQRKYLSWVILNKFYPDKWKFIPASWAPNPSHSYDTQVGLLIRSSAEDYGVKERAKIHFNYKSYYDLFGTRELPMKYPTLNECKETPFII